MKNSERQVVSLIICVLSAGLASLLARGPQQQSSPPGLSAASQQSPAARLGIFPYPKNQQSAAQQQKDEQECYGWSKQQTGIDPAAPAPPPQAKKPKGGGMKGAAGGAAAGAAVGAIAGDTGEGAAIGATAGAMRGRRQQRKAGKQAEKQAEAAAGQQKQQTLETFKKAFGGCMDGRGYSVQ